MGDVTGWSGRIHLRRLDADTLCNIGSVERVVRAIVGWG